MRASATIVVGLLVGGALGFVLRGLTADEAAVPVASGSLQSTSADVTGTGLPLVSKPSAELLTPAPLSASAVVDPVSTGASSAADELVGLCVYGALLEPDGKPARIGDRHWLSVENGPDKPRTVEVSAEATYAIAGLKAGRCVIRSDLQGYREQRQELELDAAMPAVRRDLVLQPAVVLLVKAFTPSGELLIDALEKTKQMTAFDSALAAIASRDPPPPVLPEISQRVYERWGMGSYRSGFELAFDSDGLPEDAIGKLELDESLPAYVSLLFRHIVLQTQTVQPGATEVVFVLPPESLNALLGSVHVRVVDAETHQPIAGTAADLSDSQSFRPPQPAGPEGDFTWERQRPGLLELRVSAPGYEEWNREVSVPPGGRADLGTVEITPATTMSGIAMDAEGKAVEVQLRLRSDDLSGFGMGALRSSSGADGRFEFRALGRRQYLLMVADQERAGFPVPVDLRYGNVEGVVVTVEEGIPVRLQTNWTAGDYYGVRVITESGVIISDARWRGDWTWSRHLPVGNFVAILSRDGRELKRVPFQVREREVTVDLSP